jgi:hypothetical protein
LYAKDTDSDWDVLAALLDSNGLESPDAADG